MPVIPNYSAKQNIKADVAAPLRQGEAAQPFQDTQGVLKTVADVEQKWSEANDVMQYTAAKAVHGTAMAQIEQKALSDPSFANTDDYYKQIDDAQQSAVKGISNQLVASKASADLGQDAAIAKIKIDNIQKKKQIDYTVGVALPQQIANSQTSMLTAATKNEFMQSKANMRNIIDANVQAGIIDHVQAEKMKQEAEITAAENAIYTDTARGRDQINQGYFDLNPEQKQKLISAANELDARRLKEQTEAIKEVQFQTEASFAQDIANNKPPSLAVLSDAVKAGTVSSDFATTAMKTLTSPAVVAANTNNEEFSNLTQQIFKSGSKQEVQKSMVNILKGGGDGKLSKDDLGILINSAMLQAQQKRSDVSQTITSLQAWADQSSLDKAAVLRTFQQNVASGKTVSEAADLAMKKTISDNIPGAAALEDTPNMVIGKDSPIRMIFPKVSKVYPKRIYNPSTGKLEANPEVNQNAKRTR